MNLDRIARNVAAEIAPQVIIERRLDGTTPGPAVEDSDIMREWMSVLRGLGLPANEEWLSAEKFFRAYLAYGFKLTGLQKMLAEMVADMAQEAMDTGYPEFRPKGISLVSHRSACMMCPSVRRFAGLSFTARTA